MLLKQFYLESLGHASYFIGSEKTGSIMDIRALSMFWGA